MSELMKEQVNTRIQEINHEIKILNAEKAKLRKVLKVLNEPDENGYDIAPSSPGKPGKAVAKAMKKQKTVRRTDGPPNKELVIATLRHIRPETATLNEIHEGAEARLGKPIPRSSISGALSKLKIEGVVANNDGQWRLKETHPYYKP